MMIDTHSVAASEVGHVREHNEDSVFADDELGLWIVADGMGGHASGEVASRMAVEEISRVVRSGRPLEEAIQRAHQVITAAGERNAEQRGMGSTVVAIQRQRMGFQLAWVGDSRIYIVEEGAKFRQLSFDHSLVQHMVLRGALTPEQARKDANKSFISQALGMVRVDRLSVEQEPFRPQRPGLFLLCSDGLSDMLEDDAIAGLVSDVGQSLEQRAQNLTTAVMATEAADNFSVILVAYQPNRAVRYLNALLNRVMK